MHAVIKLLSPLQNKILPDWQGTNVYFVKYDVTLSFLAQVLDTVTYFVSHVLVVDTVTYFDIFR